MKRMRKWATSAMVAASAASAVLVTIPTTPAGAGTASYSYTCTVVGFPYPAQFDISADVPATAVAGSAVTLSNFELTMTFDDLPDPTVARAMVAEIIPTGSYEHVDDVTLPGTGPFTYPMADVAATATGAPGSTIEWRPGAIRFLALIPTPTSVTCTPDDPGDPFGTTQLTGSSATTTTRPPGAPATTTPPSVAGAGASRGTTPATGPTANTAGPASAVGGRASFTG